ncbi:endonuclease NucS domain-containing protein [Pseudomonas sp. 13B_3.2_Bac1]|uniref:endonuclease NucS domain-containing protein n=1 Tax=Pseudomonas sp. 13B_3.2_Bac1 TaxID=2971623 RepID=UPI0021C9DE38|nr:endonuclease NucS domain-containing protein [Pseudomonas sp. 13B_3.2_Bac1]MCU1772253.1 endonuclease NucS [Pseudomonas sp. 13B_3.2_Bac1]
MKAVLGLYDDEAGLRDALSEQLTAIEEGLRLVGTNYVVENVHGADGSFDILAKDEFDNFVIIEVKRSNQAARQALHELSKYISLFMEGQKVDQHKIRCFVVSTEWHELDVPLSYFKMNSPVDISGFIATALDGQLHVSERILPGVDVLPKLSPDMRFIFFSDMDTLIEYAEDVNRELSNIKLLRLAFLVMEPLSDVCPEFRGLLCVWRVPEYGIETIEKFIEDPELAEDYYHFSGWELETDVLNWVMSKSDKALVVFAEDERATPEKVSNYQELYNFTKLIKLGDWPKNDLVNNLEEVLRCVIARDVSSLGRRANRHEFSLKSSKKSLNNWIYSVSAFKDFLSYSDFWVQEVTAFEKRISVSAKVEFEAWDERHFFYSVYKAVDYPSSGLSHFKLTVSEKGKADIIFFGGWAWDGKTKPSDAITNIEKAYGSLIHSELMLFSAVDEERYEFIHYEHGFHPFVGVYTQDKGKPKISWPRNSPKNISWRSNLAVFVSNNFTYCDEVSKSYSGIPRLVRTK